jgi:hypothetical protein
MFDIPPAILPPTPGKFRLGQTVMDRMQLNITAAVIITPPTPPPFVNGLGDIGVYSF